MKINQNTHLWLFDNFHRLVDVRAGGLEHALQHVLLDRDTLIHCLLSFLFLSQHFDLGGQDLDSLSQFFSLLFNLKIDRCQVSGN